MTSMPSLRGILVFALSAYAARAEVRLHNLFSDHMVLQQGTSVPVWGWADDGERVTVEFAGQKASTTAKGGKWMVKLKNLKTGPARTLKVSSTHAGQHTTIQMEDVL